MSCEFKQGLPDISNFMVIEKYFHRQNGVREFGTKVKKFYTHILPFNNRDFRRTNKES